MPAPQAGTYDHALAVGFSRGFEVSAGIMLLALIVTVAMIRVKRADLAGVEPMLAQTTRRGGGRTGRPLMVAAAAGAGRGLKK
jgi:hypothetical protein